MKNLYPLRSASWRLLPVVVILLSGLVPMVAGEPSHLDRVRAYADLMIAEGRDRVGSEPSPLFASALDRESRAFRKFGPIRGIRNGDRALRGSNPMHDQNLYQALYVLSEVTGDPVYAAEADKALGFFWKTCQSPVTGLMAWGEHLWWDFTTETIVDAGKSDYHEFFRPWVLWEHSAKLAPEAVAAFARGLWDHQIKYKESGAFSRHASWSRHAPGDKNEYPRHGGFMIQTWAEAYRRRPDPVFLEAIRSLVAMYDRISSERSGAIPCCTRPDRINMMWTESNLSLAIDCEDAARVVPADLAALLRRRSAEIDENFLQIAHPVAAGGGFVTNCDVHSFEPHEGGFSDRWAISYGKVTDAQVAEMCRLRWDQLKDGPGKEGYRRLILASADHYLVDEPSGGFPGPYGMAIQHLLSAREISADDRYLQRAQHIAAIAIATFLPDANPLPKATAGATHYETITGGDTLMMALLKLHLVENRHPAAVKLIFTDR